MTWDRTRVDGVDISTFQPEEANGHRLIDWPKAIGAGVKFVVARASFISGAAFHTDPAFPDHARAVRAAGPELGAYHFFAPNVPGRDQARRFVDAVGTWATLALAADVEASCGMQPEAIADELEAFLEEVDAITSRRTWLYSFPGFVRDSLREQSGRFFSRLLWLADYGVAEPSVPRPWWEASIWQAQGNDGRLDGFPGAVDHNVLGDGVTIEHLRTGVAPRFAPDLATTRGLQGALRALGYDVGDSVDGQLGARTRFALAAFQRRAGLTPDGVFGPAMKAALEGELAELTPSA